MLVISWKRVQKQSTFISIISQRHCFEVKHQLFSSSFRWCSNLNAKFSDFGVFLNWINITECMMSSLNLIIDSECLSFHFRIPNIIPSCILHSKIVHCINIFDAHPFSFSSNEVYTIEGTRLKHFTFSNR